MKPARTIGRGLQCHVMTDSPGVEDWEAAVSAFDRVRSVAITVTQPRSAEWIAGEAAVAESTASNHLQCLVDLDVLVEVAGEGLTRYHPDPNYSRMQALRELYDQHNREGLLELRAELKEHMKSWQMEYGMNSPEEVRKQAATSEPDDRTGEIRRTANDFELMKYRLRLVEDAIDRYDEDTVTPSG